MRQTLWLPAALFLLAACASTQPPGAADPDPVPPNRTTVDVLASELNLLPAYDTGRNRLELTGRRGSVVLYPGTNVAVVNGEKVTGMHRIMRHGSLSSVSEGDAARIRIAYRTPPKPKPASRKPAGSAALKPVPKKAAAWAKAPDPAWDVTLRRRWMYIVLHHSGTDAGSAATFHIHHRQKNGWDGLGYHFVIGNGNGSKDGQVETGYRWTRQITGAHAGRGRNDSNLMNERGIGICLVGNFDETKPTARQIAALHRLIDWLEKRCGISPDRVLVHEDVRDTHCPGRCFPAREFLVNRRTVPAAFRQ